MSQKTDAELIAEAQVIREETAVSANSKLRIYNMFRDVIDSKVNNENADIDNLLPDQTGNTGKVLKTDGSNASWEDESGGGIQSVTGDGVDNTDPDNPVLSFPTPGDIGAEIAGAAATALSDAEDYTDAAIAQEVIDRDAAISTALSGLSWKNVRVATTVAGTLSTSFENGDTVDGVTLATGDRILLKNQADPKENGIRVVAASGSPARSTDADTNAELQNSAVLVAEGTTNAGTAWVQTQSAINIGSTNIIFQQLGSSVPNADSSTRGIAKLYTALGTNTDGSIDQNTANTEIGNAKARANHTGSQLAATISDFNTAALAAAPAETTTTEGALINGATAKTTPVDADFIGLMDSAASNILKKVSWANIKATLKTYFDTLYHSLINSATALTDASTIDLTAIKHTLASSSATRTFTISYTGDDITMEVTLSATSATYTFPATALCTSEGVASGDNTLGLSGVSGDKYIIAIKKIGSAYYVVSKNFGQ